MEASGRIGPRSKDFAEVIPAAVLGEMFDVPTSDQQLLRESGVAVATLVRAPTRDIEAKAKAANEWNACAGTLLSRTDSGAAPATR